MRCTTRLEQHSPNIKLSRLHRHIGTHRASPSRLSLRFQEIFREMLPDAESQDSWNNGRLCTFPLEPCRSHAGAKILKAHNMHACHTVPILVDSSHVSGASASLGSGGMLSHPRSKSSNLAIHTCTRIQNQNHKRSLPKRLAAACIAAVAMG